jgi:hypothetical protein
MAKNPFLDTKLPSVGQFHHFRVAHWVYVLTIGKPPRPCENAIFRTYAGAPWSAAGFPAVEIFV